MDVTTGSSVFSTLLFHQLIPPREVLRSNLAPDRQYQRTTKTIKYSEIRLSIINRWHVDRCLLILLITRTVCICEAVVMRCEVKTYTLCQCQLPRYRSFINDGFGVDLRLCSTSGRGSRFRLLTLMTTTLTLK